jgi:hypothetical protein
MSQQAAVIKKTPRFHRIVSQIKYTCPRNVPASSYTSLYISGQEEFNHLKQTELEQV